MNDNPSPDPSGLSNALGVTQQSLLAFQKMQEDTAKLHKQFLDNQHAALATLQTLVAQQQALHHLAQWEGRSEQAFKQWLAERDQTWRQTIEIVAMDGFTVFKTATTEHCPTPSLSWTPSASSDSPVTPWTNAAVGSNTTFEATAAERETRYLLLDEPCTPVPTS